MSTKTDIHFTKGFIIGALFFCAFFAVCHGVLLIAGEIDIQRVIQKQSMNPNVLFSSGINQNVFSYKVKLMHNQHPEAIAVGSSRAMQFRQEFFNMRFLNLGGTVSNVADLEQLSMELQLTNPKPELLLVLLDPWWFNANHPLAKHAHLGVDYPDIINSDLLLNAIKAFERGNWFSAMVDSDNLGIHAILTGDGFSRDGSYHYTSTITSAKVASDVRFVNTLNRIKNGANRFEKASAADGQLINRACKAIKLLKRSTNQLLVIAPPFSKKVWNEMQKGGYEYIHQAYSRLDNCIEMPIYDYSNPDNLKEVTDCEFVDGFHGGDIVSARMLTAISMQNSDVYQSVDMPYMTDFIENYSGHAAGITTLLVPNSVEGDFLNLGCNKT